VGDEVPVLPERGDLSSLSSKYDFTSHARIASLLSGLNDLAMKSVAFQSPSRPGRTSRNSPPRRRRGRRTSPGPVPVVFLWTSSWVPSSFVEAGAGSSEEPPGVAPVPCRESLVLDGNLGCGDERQPVADLRTPERVVGLQAEALLERTGRGLIRPERAPVMMIWIVFNDMARTNARPCPGGDDIGGTKLLQG